ncbi:hypothetical protein ABGB07_45130 [Micromonosporaceae bacterium B7E4]
MVGEAAKGSDRLVDDRGVEPVGGMRRDRLTAPELGCPSNRVRPTLIKDEADTKSASAQLGHSSEEVTDTYYIAKPVQAPDVSEILERLGTDLAGRPAGVGHHDAHG